MQKHLEAALALGALAGASQAGSEMLYALLVEAAVEQRDQAGLRKYLPLAEEPARRIGHKLFTGIALRGWGVAHRLAGELPQAEAQLQRALELFTSYPAPWQVGRTLFEMGELSRAQGKPTEARARFSQALTAFEKLHAEPYARRTRTALEQLGHG